MERKIYVKDEYSQKIADICRVPVEYIVKLRDMGVLHPKGVRDALICHDYQILKKTNKFTSTQIIEKLSVTYDLKSVQVYDIIKKDRNKKYFCRKCGNPVMKRIFFKNDGICDTCIAKSIHIDL